MVWRVVEVGKSVILEVINSATCFNVFLCCTVQVSAVTMPGLEVPFSVHLWWRMSLTLQEFGVHVLLEQPMIKPWALLLLNDALDKVPKQHAKCLIDTPELTQGCVFIHIHLAFFYCTRTHDYDIDLTARPARLLLLCFLLSEPANHVCRSFVRKCTLYCGTLLCYILCLPLFYVCASSLENLFVFCGRSGSLFKPMRVHYCDPSPSPSVPTLTYCGVYAAIFGFGLCAFVCVFLGNLSSYAFCVALCEWVSCLCSQWQIATIFPSTLVICDCPPVLIILHSKYAVWAHALHKTNIQTSTALVARCLCRDVLVSDRKMFVRIWRHHDFSVSQSYLFFSLLLLPPLSLSLQLSN